MTDLLTAEERLAELRAEREARDSLDARLLEAERERTEAHRSRDAERAEAQTALDAALAAYEDAAAAAVAAYRVAAEAVPVATAARRKLDAARTRATGLGLNPGPSPASGLSLEEAERIRRSLGCVAPIRW